MPLLDHSKPPLSLSHPWLPIHSAWASEIARYLNRLLPLRYFALENKKFGTEIEIDIGTFDTNPDLALGSNGTATAVLTAPTWAPPAPTKTISLAFPDTLEVKVFLRDGQPILVAAIELVSPRNKDRPSAREAFVAKVAGYLSEGVSVVVLDASTERKARLHGQLLELFGQADAADKALVYFAASYRPVLRDERAELDVWAQPVAVGDVLPTMPLRLTEDFFVPVDFERTYTDVCRDRRVP